MNKTLTLIFIIIFLLRFQNDNAQLNVDKINRLEKAVFSIESFDSSGSPNRTASGFFISPDGIAITSSSVFIDADSTLITLENGKEYNIERVLSTHKMANITMIKVSDSKAKDFEYLTPSQNNKIDLSEVLILSPPIDKNKGIYMAGLNHVFEAPYIGRLVITNSEYSEKANGSPVVDSKGNLIGIAGLEQQNKTHYYISSRVLNDSLWTSYPYNNWKEALSNKKRRYLLPYFNDGLIQLAKGNWVESAKEFTLYLKNDSTNIEAHILRGEARRQYENYYGMKSDFNYVNSVSKSHFLLSYFEAHYLLSKNKKQEALEKYIESVNANGTFSLSLVDFGLLLLEIKNDAESALKCYNEAIVNDPLYAKGFYERSRLMQQYFNRFKLAREDIDIAINLDRKLPGAYSIRATIKMANQEYMEALTDLNMALDLDPSDTHALFNRGIAYYNLGMKNKSCQDWSKAGQLGHYKAIKFLNQYCSKQTSNKISY